MKTVKELMGLDEAEKMKDEDPCWDTHQMVGMKMKNGRKVPNCVPKAKAKNEEVEQIDELNKDTVYSYNKKADADIEKKHKSLGQLMRKGDAAGANKAAHQLNKRVAGMERAEKRLNTEEVEIEEAKKTTPNAKPVDPKNLVVSLKDVPVKKPRGHTQYDPAKEFPGVKALKREEVEIEEEEVKKAKMTPQERAYKRKLGLKAVVGAVHEAVKAMKDKKGDPSQSKNVKRGEPLSGKQEPVKLNPELQEK